MAATGASDRGRAVDQDRQLADSGDGWRIYTGTGQPHDRINQLPPPPRWRIFDGGPVIEPRLPAGGQPPAVTDRARRYRASENVIELVNAALYLRRPLLVTGKPGTGKSTLAGNIAYELNLGPVLTWPISSRSALQDGLYRYDAIGRLHEANLERATAAGTASPEAPDIGRYVRLGPLGTALLPQVRPRVLLIDELDKSDIDLPNDLLNVFEEGEFEIPELARLPQGLDVVEVMSADGTERVSVRRGHVRCRAFPIVVITSNEEREFPPAFLRRCLRLDITPPTADELARIVTAWLGEEAVRDSSELIERFLNARNRADLATDQLLNAIHLATAGRPPEATRERLIASVLRRLGEAGPR